MASVLSHLVTAALLCGWALLEWGIFTLTGGIWTLIGSGYVSGFALVVLAAWRRPRTAASSE